MFKDRFRQFLNLLLPLAQVIASFVAIETGLDFAENTSRDFVDPIIVPASYAFSIWGPIYIACIAYAIYQVRPKLEKDKLLRKIGFPMAIAFTGTTLWLFLAAAQLTWLTLLCMFVILGALIKSYLEIHKEKKWTKERFWFIKAPISIFTGWITAASFLNIAATLSEARVMWWIDNEVNLTVFALILLGLFASWMIHKGRGNLIYTLTLVWALLAVVVRNGTDPRHESVAYVAAVVSVALIWVQEWNRVRRKK